MQEINSDEVANVKKRISVEDKLLEQYKNFLEYCRAAGKEFADDLTEKDLIDYGAEFFVAREEIDRLKNLFGFQAENSDEKIFASNIYSVESRMSLRKYYFHLEDITPYEDVKISHLNLSIRTKNALTDGGYEKLGQVLKASRKELLELRNFGVISFNELIEDLKNFFVSWQKEIPAEILELDDKELDEFLHYEISKPNPQVYLIIAALERFPQAARAEKFFACLPDEIKNKNARAFLLAYGLNKINLPADITLAQLSAHYDLKDADLKKFIREFLFDVRSYVKNFLVNLWGNPRAFETLRLRAKGARLDQIGKKISLTRERSRQLILSSVEHFKRRKPEVLKIFFFLRALNDNKILITLDDLKKLVDEDDAEILFFLTGKANFQNDFFHFDEQIKMLMFYGGINLNEEELLKNFSDIMEEKSFVEKIQSLAREKNCPAELIKTKVMKFYSQSGTIFHRARLTLTLEFDYILKEKFPDGYKINDEKPYRQLVQYLKEIFDVNNPPSQRASVALFNRVGVLCARGKYIHPDYVHVPQEIIDQVKNFIDSSKLTAISYKEIFTRLKNIFVDTQITNSYMLQGVIKLYNLPYTFRRDYLTKADEMNMGKEFDGFFAERGEVSIQELRKTFASLSNANIEILLKRCPEILRVAENKFMHASRLNLREEDFELIKNFLRKKCSTPVSARILLGVFKKNFSVFMARNKIQKSEKLFSVLRYMFRDEFKFSRPYISNESAERITNKKILLNALEGKDRVKIKKLFAIRTENAMGNITKTYLIENMSPEFIRIDKFNLARPKSVGVTDEIVSAVVQVVRATVERNDGWIASQIFSEYKQLPKLPIPWNNFLLEGVMTLAKNSLPSLRIPLTSVNITGVVFLAEKFADENFQSFVRKILLARHKKEPFRSKDEVLVWLRAQGFCDKNLPKFLTEGNLLGF